MLMVGLVLTATVCGWATATILSAYDIAQEGAINSDDHFSLATMWLIFGVGIPVIGALLCGAAALWEANPSFVIGRKSTLPKAQVRK